MKRVFLDTSYIKALADRHDDLHERAKTVSAALGSHIKVTSQMVLTEVLNFLRGKGKHLRAAVLPIIDLLHSQPNTQVIPQTSQQFNAALALYRQRMDKGYSLTDCASMLIMEEEGIQNILTADKHFEQAGFKALLRED